MLTPASALGVRSDYGGVRILADAAGRPHATHVLQHAVELAQGELRGGRVTLPETAPPEDNARFVAALKTLH